MEHLDKLNRLTDYVQNGYFRQLAFPFLWKS